MAKFVIHLVYGEDRDRLLATRPTHREYLKRLTDQGVLLVSGPFVDDRGAMLIYEVSDEAEARRVLDADPFTAAGVIAEKTIREWSAVSGGWLA